MFANSMASQKKFEDLDLSNDEVKRIGEALKDEKFRKLFIEYAEEISNPENRKRYEEEIAQLENERGMDVQFVHPEPGYVLKTSVDSDKKAFINICKNNLIDKPTSTPQRSPDGRKGLNWLIPHSFAPPKDDVDNGKQCTVFDVVFHPDAYRMAETSNRFEKLVEDTALDGIEKQFGVKLDRNNIKRLKMKYKGVATATVIRKKQTGGSPWKPNENDPLKDMPYPYDDRTTEQKTREKNEEIKKREEQKKKQSEKTKVTLEKEKYAGFTEPKYSIIHRTNMDLQEYRNSPDSRPSTRPRELEIQIDLPLLTSAAQANLDVFEKRLTLESEKPAAYKLDLNLPFKVDDDQGSAKFDKSKKRLIVTLPVVPVETPDMPIFNEENRDLNEEADTMEGRNAMVNGHESPNVPNGIHDTKPLIEVMSSEISAVNNREGPEDTVDADDVKVTKPVSFAAPPKPAISYTFPEFSFHQDLETVYFILKVKYISEETVSKTFQSAHSCTIKFASIGSGGFPMHYSFHVQFSEDCCLVAEHCTVDVSEENVVILLLKHKSCRSMWDKFKVGLDDEHLQEKLFTTEANLQRELEQLQSEGEGLASMSASEVGSEAATLKVTEMNQKRLTVKIKRPDRDSSSDDRIEEEDEESDVPSSAEIHVVHDRYTPNLHSILKQRSMSESSDDYYNNSSGGSAGLSPRDDSGDRKKSVSFNARVDHTTYKPGASVTAMKTTLKSKRRRNRKKEEKKRNGRQRHGSGGSEGSSGDDHDLRKRTDSQSLSEEDLDEGDEIPDEFNQKDVRNEGDVDDGEPEDLSPDVDLTGSVGGIYSEKVTTRCEDNVGLEEFRTGGSVYKDTLPEFRTTCDSALSADTDQCENIEDGERTSKNDDGNELNDVEKSVEEDVLCESVSRLHEKENEQETTEVCVQNSGSNPDQVIDEDSSLEMGGSTSMVEKDTIKSQEDAETIPSQSGFGDGGIEVESMLEWKQNDGNKGGMIENEHKTQCAFSFSNDVMFDLDDD